MKDVKKSPQINQKLTPPPKKKPEIKRKTKQKKNKNKTKKTTVKGRLQKVT